MMNSLMEFYPSSPSTVATYRRDLPLSAVAGTIEDCCFMMGDQEIFVIRCKTISDRTYLTFFNQDDEIIEEGYVTDLIHKYSKYM